MIMNETMNPIKLTPKDAKIPYPHLSEVVGSHAPTLIKLNNRIR